MTAHVDEPEACPFEVYVGRYYGDPPEPPEYCGNDVSADNEYCELHAFAQDSNEPGEYS